MTTKPAPPKRPLNPTFQYLQEHRETYRKDHPTLKITEVTSKLSDQYKNLSAKEKEKYESTYTKAKAEYEKVVDSDKGQESLRREARQDRDQAQEQER
jgi:hypothetical protein